MPKTRQLRDPIIIEVASVHMHGISLYHMDVTKSLEDLSIFIEIGAITGHRGVAVA